jgi:ribosomal protein S18 acetylase RimI-like enzyme
MDAPRRPGADSLLFRNATAADVPAVVALVESAYRGESSRIGWTTEAHLLGGQRTDPDAVLEIIGAPDSRLLTVHREGRLVACCQLARRADHAYFGMFAVRPDLQGAGLGRAILAEAERSAREEWGAPELRMTVIGAREDLIAWYERRGYLRTGRVLPFPHHDRRFGIPHRAGLDFAELAKTLTGQADAT